MKLADALNKDNGREPLSEYTWQSECDRLIDWAIKKDSDTLCFMFDLVMSLAFVDATAGLENYIEYCPALPNSYNFHLGFINLCSPCYENLDKWIYQKAAKPQSGAIGKLTSEVILRFIERKYKNFEFVRAIGGTDIADALIKHAEGWYILAEVKAAPLVTYPILFKNKKFPLNKTHKKTILTSSQVKAMESALYLHRKELISLGKPSDVLWPFKPAADYVTSKKNEKTLEKAIATWKATKEAYSARDRSSPLYFLANASGAPPREAVTRDGWPSQESISDSKTSAGMDRTDDIKKGIYQVLKLGTSIKDQGANFIVRTALISNLPAFRHSADYIDPMINILWGIETEVEEENNLKFIKLEKLRRLFDLILTLDSPIIRDVNL